MDLISKYQSKVDEKKPAPKKFIPLSDIHAGSFITQSAMEEARIRIMTEMLATWGSQIDDQGDRFEVTGTRIEGNQMVVSASYRPLQSLDYINVTTSLVEADRPDRNGNVYTQEALQRGVEMHERYGVGLINSSTIASSARLRGTTSSAMFIDEYSFVPNSEIKLWDTPKKISPQDVAKAVMNND